MSAPLPEVDPKRLEEEWEADAEVLVNLAANGDNRHLPRGVDVSFRGDEEALDRLEADADQFGFTVLDREEDEEGDLYLFLEITQPVDEESIRALTLKCLQIELLYGVEYDGWGCNAETGGN